MIDNPYQSPGDQKVIPLDALLYVGEKLVLKFNLSLDDITAFYAHYLAHSKTLRHQKYLVTAIVSGIPLVIAFAVSRENNPPWEIILAALLLSVVFGIFYHFAHKSAFLRNARRMVTEGSTRGVLGPHQLEMDEIHLVSRSEIRETRMLLTAIDRIEETDSHAFFYISAVQAHVIPKRHGEMGDPIHFIQRARELVAQAKSSPP